MIIRLILLLCIFVFVLKFSGLLRNANSFPFCDHSAWGNEGQSGTRDDPVFATHYPSAMPDVGCRKVGESN